MQLYIEYLHEAKSNFTQLFINSLSPLSSDRQYLSYGVCLGVRGEIIRSVLGCIDAQS